MRSLADIGMSGSSKMSVSSSMLVCWFGFCVGLSVGGGLSSGPAACLFLGGVCGTILGASRVSSHNTIIVHCDGSNEVLWKLILDTGNTLTPIGPE